MPVKLPSLKPLRKYILANCDIKIHRVGAITFNANGNILAMACNRKGNGYVSPFSYHAEEMVLSKGSHPWRKSRSKAYILVVRIRGGSDYGLAKPCEGCHQLCKEAGVSGIYYTTVNGIRSL
jgi:cytidine deaminase